MNIETLIESVCNMDMSYSVRRAALTVVNLEKIRGYIEQLPDSVTIDPSQDKIILTAYDRTETSKLLQIFGGNWTKELAEWDKTRIEYSQIINGCLIVINSEPPPSCKIIEEDVEIPAHIEKRKRLECPKKTEDEESITETIETL